MADRRTYLCWSLRAATVFSNPPGVYNPPAVPSDVAQGAHYPAGARREIQAVTQQKIELSQSEIMIFPPDLIGTECGAPAAAAARYGRYTRRARRAKAAPATSNLIKVTVTVTA